MWNTKTPKYFSDSSKKREAWLQIACDMYPDENFDIKLESERDEIANSLLIRWKNLRDYYTREHKKVKQDPDAYIPKFAYFNHLAFLGDRPTRAKRRSRNLLDGTPKRQKMLKVLKGEVKGEIEVQPEEVEYEEVITETEEEQEVYLEADEHLVTEADETEFVSTSQEARDSLMAALSESLSKQQERQEPDEHEMFLKSLLPDLRKVPSSKKLRVRMDILSTINKALQD